MSDLVIETENLRKEFGARVAVKGLTLQVRRGEVFGFLGPNGAGKTTSMKMLLGLSRPTSGHATILGRALGDVAVRRAIGFLPEHFRFHEWLTAAEFLHVHGRFYGMSSAHLCRRVPALLELVGLADHRNKKLRTFSKGMLQRIGLAQALLNDPELIFLDEPTSGLDPVGRILVRDIVHDQRRRGATVFLNSHLLSEVEVTCDRVAFIKHGEVLQTKQLHDTASEGTQVVVRATHVTSEVLNGLASRVGPIEVEGDTFTFRISDASVVPEVTRYLVAHGVDVYEITPQRLSLEQWFIRIVGTDGGL
ncbi:MAG: ABC transporter ATP-binding protein [Acidobacteriota bacterium]|nr:ABC transporter ATP-binding protein [Blastocatellia bacterium]MDW8240203.1 ABC transporter ATP-binding protein [Acidobacteriota bacterium]